MYIEKVKTHLLRNLGFFFIIGTVFSAEKPPIYFFYNVAIEENIENMAGQLELAESHGVNTVAFHTGMPWGLVPGSDSPEQIEKFFRKIEAVNDNARFIPRCYLQPPRIYKEKYPDDFPVMPGVDFSVENHASPGSDRLFDLSVETLRTAVRHLENSPFGDRIPIYYLAAQETGEWIPYLYRSGGADRSPANADKFRRWLTRKYKTDINLQTAWGNKDLSLTGAAVPNDTTGRFPMSATTQGETLRMFYRLPEEQNWVDYSEYISDVMANRIQELAAVVREETDGAKQSLVFYGYVYELPGSMSAHLNMGEILRNPDIHSLGAPMSYIHYPDRLSGGPGGCMTALDSLPLHGKQWLSEIDIATYAQKPDAYIPEWYWDDKESYFEVSRTKEQTRDILERIFAFSAAHGSTLWWMDLFGAGWFSDTGLWDTLDQEMGRHFVKLADEKRMYTPDVAVIVDEKSRLYEHCTWSGFYELYPMLRNEVMRTGASAGFYYLDDFLEGRVPQSKVCLFVNLWNTGRVQKERIHELLKRDGSTAIWQYAPGWLNGGPEGVNLMTGFSVEADEGECRSQGVGLLSGLSWGPAYNIEPRIDIKKRGVEVLARYADGQISAAFKKQNGVDHYLIGSPGIPAEALRHIFEKAGVHLWSSPEGIVNTDGKTFVHLHASRDEEYRISIPSIEGVRGRTERYSLKKGESVFIKLGGD
jgi:hypothetical protein